MRILRLFILNCGVFKQNVIDFTDKNGEPQDFLCLSGVNGSGKTTVMELIFNLMHFLDPDFGVGRFNISRRRPHIFSNTEFAQLDLLYEGKLISLVVGEEKYIQKDLSYEQMFIINSQIGNIAKEWDEYFKEEYEEDELIAKEERLKELLFTVEKNKPKIVNEQIFPNLLSEIKQAKKGKKKNTNYPSVYYFPVNIRFLIDKRYREIPKYIVKYDVARRFNSTKDDLNSIFVFTDYAKPELFKELTDWINENILVDKKITKIDREQFKTIVETERGDEHGLELLSSGEQNLLIVSVQIFLHANKNTLFLIDEVDESLHPEFQSKMITILKEIQKLFECQIIISSHSKHIWNEFKDNDQARIRLTEVVR